MRPIINNLLLLLAFLAVLLVGHQSVAIAKISSSDEKHIIDIAKKMAASGYGAASDAGQTEFDYRELRPVRTDGKLTEICGEVKSSTADEWSKFRYDISENRAFVEPYPQFNHEAANWFSAQCKAAIRRLKPGQIGTQAEIRNCDAAALFSQVKYERARFDFVHAAFCPAP